MSCPGTNRRRGCHSGNAPSNASGRCDACEETVLEDCLLAMRVLHDPEDIGAAEDHPDVVRFREALVPFETKRRRRDMLIGAASFGGGVL